MPDPVVNASPVILLARGGYLDLLQLAGPRLLVPDIVVAEIRRRPAGDPSIIALHLPWLIPVASGPVPPALAAFRLDAGETAVLAWALAHPGTEAIIDDLPGRRAADALGIPTRGCLGLVPTAKQRGVIPAARPLIERPRMRGLYLSDAVVQRALSLAGE